MLCTALSPGEGDMRYLAEPDDRLVFVPPLRRAIAPVDDLRALITLYRELRRFHPAVIHAHGQGGTAGSPGGCRLQPDAAARHHAPVSCTYHGHVLEVLRRSADGNLHRARASLARMSDTIVAISLPFAASCWNSPNRPARAYRVILGFDLAPFATLDREGAHPRAALEIADDAPVVTTVGRLTSIKQHHLFLDVAAQAVARHP